VEECWEYEHAVLGALEASGETVASWFAAGQIELGSVTVAFTPQQGIHPERRDSRASGMYEPLPWASITWRTVTTDTTSGVLHEALVAAGAPAFVNFDQAAAAFFRTPHQVNRRFDGHEIVIREQDPRARIERVRIRAAELVVSVGGDDLAGKRLTLSGPTVASQGLDADTAEWSLPLPDGLPEGAWLALHDDRQLLDSRALDPTWRPPADVEFEIEPATRVEALISRGEGATLEFKRELPGEDASRVMKTVAAFANGQGGTMLFGVTDEQQIIGLGDALTREAIDHLTRLISDHVQPHPPFEVETISVGEAEGRSSPSTSGLAPIRRTALAQATASSLTTCDAAATQVQLAPKTSGTLCARVCRRTTVRNAVSSSRSCGWGAPHDRFGRRGRFQLALPVATEHSPCSGRMPHSG